MSEEQYVGVCFCVWADVKNMTWECSGCIKDESFLIYIHTFFGFLKKKSF